MGKNPAQKAKQSEAKATGTVKSASREKKKPAKKKVAAAPVDRAKKTCKMKGCKRAYRAKNYCRVHYTQWRRGAYGKVRYKHCHDVACAKPMAMNRHGFCEEHYQNFYVKGMEQTKVETPAKPEAKPAEKTAAA